jgi:hypothetical protein
MLAILIATHGIPERKVPSDAPKEQLSRIAPDISSNAGEELVVQDQECEDQGTVANRRTESLAEHISESYTAGEDAHETAQSGGSPWQSSDFC